MSRAPGQPRALREQLGLHPYNKGCYVDLIKNSFIYVG
jgi:hypothetical protein